MLNYLLTSDCHIIFEFWLLCTVGESFSVGVYAYTTFSHTRIFPEKRFLEVGFLFMVFDTYCQITCICTYLHAASSARISIHSVVNTAFFSSVNLRSKKKKKNFNLMIA